VSLTIFYDDDDDADDGDDDDADDGDDDVRSLFTKLHLKLWTKSRGKIRFTDSCNSFQCSESRSSCED